MSAQEFGEWKTMYSAEGLHPAAQRLQHAQLLASAHNGPLTRRDRSLWAAADLLPADPWADQAGETDAAAITPADLFAQVERINRLLH